MKGGAVETDRSLGFTCNVKKLDFSLQSEKL